MRALTLLVLGAWLAGLSLVGTAATPVNSPPHGEVILSGHRFQVEIADTDAAREHGLMDRTHLAADHGMLFVYSEPRIRLFWMKDTLIPLDILFFDAHKRLINASADTPPCKTRTCPTYASRAPAQYVLELNAGIAEQLRLTPGALLQIQR